MKYQTKPMVVEAFRVGYDKTPDWFPFKLLDHITSDLELEILIPRKNPSLAPMIAHYGDWIINDLLGFDLYPCSHEDFLESFDKVVIE